MLLFDVSGILLFGISRTSVECYCPVICSSSRSFEITREFFHSSWIQFFVFGFMSNWFSYYFCHMWPSVVRCYIFFSHNVSVIFFFLHIVYRKDMQNLTMPNEFSATNIVTKDTENLQSLVILSYICILCVCVVSKHLFTSEKKTAEFHITVKLLVPVQLVR